MEKIPRDKIGLHASGQIAPREAGFDQHRPATEPACGLDIARRISHDSRAAQVDMESPRRLFVEKGIRLSAAARNLVFRRFPGIAAVGVVRTIIDGIELGSLIAKQCFQLVVKALHLRRRKQPARNLRPVGDGDFVSSVLPSSATMISEPGIFATTASWKPSMTDSMTSASLCASSTIETGPKFGRGRPVGSKSMILQAGNSPATPWRGGAMPPSS